MNCRYCGASGAEVGVGDDGLCIDAYKCEERHDLMDDDGARALEES